MTGFAVHPEIDAAGDTRHRWSCDCGATGTDEQLLAATLDGAAHLKACELIDAPKRAIERVFGV